MEDCHFCKKDNCNTRSLLVFTVLCVQRSIAKVEWSAGGTANVYRVGHMGKVMSSQCQHKLL